MLLPVPCVLCLPCVQGILQFFSTYSGVCFVKLINHVFHSNHPTGVLHWPLCVINSVFIITCHTISRLLLILISMSSKWKESLCQALFTWNTSSTRHMVHLRSMYPVFTVERFQLTKVEQSTRKSSYIQKAYILVWI